YRSALVIQRKLADDNPTVTKFREFLASHHANLAWLLWQKGGASVAEAEYRTALAIQRKLADDNPTMVQFRNSLATMYSDLGTRRAAIRLDFASLMGQPDQPSQAEAEFRSALGLYRRLADDNPAVADLRDSQARCHTGLGVLLAQEGKPTEAEAEYRAALAIQQ